MTYGSSKSSSADDACSPCNGSCTWTTNDDNFAKSVWWIISGDNQQCGGSNITACLCNFPSRPPDFFGDIQITDCSCCPGCQWVYSIGFGWEKNPNSPYCFPFIFDYCGGDCPSPLHVPERNEDGLLQSYITGCGEILSDASDSSLDSSESSLESSLESSDSISDSISDSDSNPSSDSGSDSSSDDYLCVGDCAYMWIESTQEWDLWQNYCGSSENFGDCGCTQPEDIGEYDGQIVLGTCGKV